MTFYDAEDLEIGADARNGESFSYGEVREFPASPAASVSKVVVTITKISLVLIRDSVSTRPSCRICIFLYQSVHWGFGVWGLGFWGFGDGREVNLVVGGQGLRGQGWTVGLAQRAGKYPVVNVFSRY